MNQTVVLKHHFTTDGVTAGRNWTRHDFKDAGGNKYQTFDDGLASKADSLLNQLVEVEYESESRGQYTNNNLKGVKPASTPNGEHAAADPRVATVVDDLYAAQDAQSTRELRIMRQSALQRAIDTVGAGVIEAEGLKGNPKKLFEIADTYLLYFEAGSSAFTQQAEELKF